MRILLALTYYRPYISGVTIYNQRLAEALVERGHQVTVLTARYDTRLPLREALDGMNIVRLPVWLRISKGALMLGYQADARRMIAGHDAVVMNLPNTPLEAYCLPRLARAAGRPIIAVYHCDVVLPPGLFNRLIQAGVAMSNRYAARRVDRIVSYSHDYSRHSRLLRDFADRVHVIRPPICVRPVDPDRVGKLRREHQVGGVMPRYIGFAARLAAEKGVEQLLEALPAIEAAAGPIRLLMAGESDHVIGEQACRMGMAPLIQAQGKRVHLLGVLPPDDMSHFYAACDVTVLPSRNATESFGMVQVESMLCGTPVVSSDLPGVRVPTQLTGMGRACRAGDASALAEALIDVLCLPERYRRPRCEIERHFSVDRTAQAFEKLLEHCVARVSRRPRPELEGSIVCPSRRNYLADHLKEVPAFRALLRSVECLLMEQAGPLQQPVLDLGCGDGHFASMAFSSPLFSGVDPDAAALREADRAGAFCHALRADARRLPFASGSFATVLANSSLEHIPAMEDALTEVSRVLQRGGRLLLTTPSEYFGALLMGSTLLKHLGMGRAGRAYGNWFNRHSRHFHTDPPNRWLDRMRNLGLDVEHWQYYFSAEAHRAFDLAHYLSIPRLISRRLTKRWMPLPSPLVNTLFEIWLRRYVDARPQTAGAYLFVIARKG